MTEISKEFDMLKNTYSENFTRPNIRAMNLE